MTAILGIFGPAGAPPLVEGVTQRMLAAMRSRGADRTAVWRGDGATLAVARHDWELGAGFAEDVLVLEEGDLVVAADATLYYRADLRGKLKAKRVTPTGGTPSHLILAAYRAWGRECAAELEGDFSFILWDRRTRRLVAARDYGGRRPLFYAELGGALVVASGIAGILQHPRASGEVNLASVAEAAAGLFGATPETSYRGVFRLPHATTMARVDGGALQTIPNWEPPIFEQAGGPPFAEAAEQLRDLLGRATEERLDTGGPTAVWMSGGWDSTAIFGAGRKVIRDRGAGGPLLPVSISYPPGDPGREDEIILEIAKWWNSPVHWLDIREIPFFDRTEERAAAREEPISHVYEMWNRALVGGARQVEARVALDGYGGDSLFQCSPVFLADLLRRGRWWTMWQEWRAATSSGGRTASRFFQTAVLPNLPDWALSGIAAARGGRPLKVHMQRDFASWVDTPYTRQLGLHRYTLPPVVRRPGESISAAETQWQFRTPWIPCVLNCNSSFAVEAGVEVRSPIYDRRVIEFAARRPRWERRSTIETKQLLRHSMKGLLPPRVLQPRTYRTGMTTGYLRSSLLKGLPGFLEPMLRSSALAEAGIIDLEAVRRGLDEFRRTENSNLGISLLWTLQAEWWLASRLGRSASLAAPDATGLSVAAV